MLRGIKALIVIWPFLKSVAFKDRTIREVLRANRQFTWLFALLVVVLLTLHLTIHTLADQKKQLALRQAELERVHRQLAQLQARENTKRTGKGGTTSSMVCYDPNRVLELLHQTTE